MRIRPTHYCLALLILTLCAGGCLGTTGDDGTSVPSSIGASTDAPTTTTLSEAQIALEAMTVREKAAQVLMLAFSGTSLTPETTALLAAGPPGGLIILGYNVADALQMRALTEALQQAAAATGSPVGLLLAVDQEGGQVQRIKQGMPVVPSARSLGTDSTPSEAAELATLTARGLLDLGINMNLVPVADVVSDKKSFLFDRSYGSDPESVADFVTAVIRASEGQGLICVTKHFPGHGSASGDSHSEAAISAASRQEFESVHLPPFRAAIAAGVEGVMVSHIVAKTYDSAYPASLSAPIVNDLLRGELGFEGLVVADDLSMAAALGRGVGAKVQADEAQPDAKVTSKAAAEALAAVDALNAGCDLLILTELEGNSQVVLDHLVAAIERGEVSQARLDKAVLKILDLKFRYGLKARPYSGPTTSQPTEERSR